MSSPISPEDRDRFLREVIANSPPTGISARELERALGDFIVMNVDAAALAMWQDGRLSMGWRDGNMIWHITSDREVS